MAWSRITVGARQELAGIRWITTKNCNRRMVFALSRTLGGVATTNDTVCKRKHVRVNVGANREVWVRLGAHATKE